MSFIYTFSSGSTEVYDASDYSGVDTLQAVSQANQNLINSVYNINYQKIFAGPGGGGSITGLTIYDSGNTKTVINVSGDTFGIAVDNTNDLVALIDVSQSFDFEVKVVDASTNTVVRTIEVVNSYKGDIASDNNGYCYVVGETNTMTKVDIVNGVTADTISIGGTGINKKLLFNGVNNFIYVYSNNDGYVKSFDASDGSPLNTLNITANTTFFIFNPDKEQIYLGKVTGGTNDFVIITLSRNLTLISETFIFSGLSPTSLYSVFGFYSTETQYLYVGEVDSDSILVLTT